MNPSMAVILRLMTLHKLPLGMSMEEKKFGWETRIPKFLTRG